MNTETTTPILGEEEKSVLRFINIIRQLPSCPQKLKIAERLYKAGMFQGHRSNGDVHVFLTPAGIQQATQAT